MPVSPTRSRPLLSLALAALKAVLMYPVRVMAARRVMGQVGSMSEYELRDIGLTRQDVWDARALPLGTDPGRLFQGRVHERLQARLDRSALAVKDLCSPPRRIMWRPARPVTLQRPLRVIPDGGPVLSTRTAFLDVNRQ